MKPVMFDSGIGNGESVVGDAQLLTVSMVPGNSGSWVRIGRSKSIWIPPNATLSLEAADLGRCCGDSRCDQFPGNQQIRIVFGQEAWPGDDRLPLGDEPLSWLVVYTGCE